MKLAIHIELGGAAMLTGDDLAEALEHVAIQLRGLPDEITARDATTVTILDANGNTVGDWRLGAGKRDATGAALAEELDGVLESMAAGDLGVTETTRHMAQAELDARRQRRDR